MVSSLIARVKPANLLLILLLLFLPAIAACSQAKNGGASNANAAANDANAIQVGVLVAFDGTDATRKRFEPMLNEIGEALGKPVVFVPMTPRSQFIITKTSNVDFVLTNPLASAQLNRLHNTTFLATVSRLNTDTEFGGVIVVRPDSPIKTVADLRDKKGACVSLETAAAGCLFQLYHAQQAGLDPIKDLIIQEIPSQDKIVQDVIDGNIDFGFVRAGRPERMAKDGTIASADAVRILDPIDDGYPIPHTTELYPEWALAATENTPPELIDDMQNAVLNIPEGNAALEQAGIKQFVPAVSYDKVVTLIDSLKAAGINLD